MRRPAKQLEKPFHTSKCLLGWQLLSELLELALADNARARLLLADGSYRPVPRKGADKVRRSQFEFITLAGNGGRGAKSPRAKRKYPEVNLAGRPF